MFDVYILGLKRAKKAFRKIACLRVNQYLEQLIRFLGSIEIWSVEITLIILFSLGLHVPIFNPLA